MYLVPVLAKEATLVQAGIKHHKNYHYCCLVVSLYTYYKDPAQSLLFTDPVFRQGLQYW